eukprot:TRINITY_DN42_c0_g1_i1.p1 TRINITY_DN42_c0_g1~~TRINITY_DN42_c0_g1_i1.p1  ORF type:complete len:716 (-),score=172.53 TRINITY_DN42_c0_g1_i1:514-2622(-)
MEPTAVPTCPEGYSTSIRTQPVCTETTGTSTFTLSAGNFYPVLGVPLNALDFEATLQATGGNCDLQLYAPTSSGGLECIVGGTDNCLFSSTASMTAVYEGMSVSFTGDDRNPPVVESIQIPAATVFTAIRVYAVEECSGSVDHSWRGIAPCGDNIVECIPPPSPAPTDEPTLDPVTSEPSFRPTTSPTTAPSVDPTPSPTDAPTISSPTFYPSQAPTCHYECSDYVPEGETKWYDSFGEFFTCDYYAQAPTELCTQTGDMFTNFGKNAREACCACNGNHDCGRVCDVVVMFKTCPGANSTTQAWPTATICDMNGNCQRDFYLDPREDILWANPLWPILAGTKYAWRVPTSMFDSYASTVTLNAAQDGVCIEDVWLDYELVNDPTDPIYLASSQDEFPEENILTTVTFDAPTCRAPSASPTMTPSPEPTDPPTKTPSQAPLECTEVRQMYYDLMEQYNDQEETCANIESQYMSEATRDGCDYGVTCARCDSLVPGTNTASSSGSQDALELGTFRASTEERGPQSDTILYIQEGTNEVFVRDGNMFRRTCVEYKPAADMYCLNEALYCAGDGVVGSLAEIENAVLVAMSQNDGIHPECPSSCMGLSDTVKEHFEKMGVPDYENVCTFNGMYFYKDAATKTRKFTCVAAGERLAECPANECLCVGFDDNTGMKTYGFYDWQAAAVKTALGLESGVHPFCPSYQSI